MPAQPSLGHSSKTTVLEHLKHLYSGILLPGVPENTVIPNSMGFDAVLKSLATPAPVAVTPNSAFGPTDLTNRIRLISRFNYGYTLPGDYMAVETKLKDAVVGLF